MLFIGENQQNLAESLLPFTTKLIENNSTNNNYINNNNNNSMSSSNCSSNNYNNNSFYNNPNFVHTGLAATFGAEVYSDEERIHRMQRLLAMKLAPEEVATRSGPGGSKLSYVEGYRVINIANEIFGFNGWTTSVKRETTDYVDTNVEKGTFNVGCSALVVVTIQGGITREDTGYGKMENARTKGDALEKCKKEAVTDGIKRALRQIGNLLGNCLYDKTYLKSLENMTKKPKKLDFSTIYRSGQNVPGPTAVEDPLAPVSVAPPPATDVKATASTIGSSRPNSNPPQQVSKNRKQQVPPKSVELVAEAMSVDLPEEEETPISSGDWCDAGMEGEDSGFIEASFLQASEQKPVPKPAPRAPLPPAQSKPAPVVNAAKQFHPSVTTPTPEQLKASQQRRMEAQQRLKAKEQNEANSLNANMNRGPQQQQQQQQQRVAAPQQQQQQQAVNGSVSASKLLSNARSLSNPISTTPKTAPRPGLRPPQPPSRTASLNRQPLSNVQQQQQQQHQQQQARQSPPMVQAGHLPTLNVGGSGARLSLAAGGGGGSVSDLSPGALGFELNGGGFMSAGRMKRTAEAHDSDSYEFNSHQQNYHLPREGEGSPIRGGGGSRREPLAELEMQVGGELKRSRLE